MPRKKLNALLLFFFLIIILIPASTSYNAQNMIIYVPDDYPTIQEAINNAKEGDTIFVRIGIYNENIAIEKPINLIGEKKNKTIIDGQGKGNTITLTCERITINGFTITNGSQKNVPKIKSWDSAGIRLNASNNTIISNIITNNNLGIFGTQITNITICNNDFLNDGINFYPYDTCLNRPPLMKKHYKHVIKNNTVNGKPLLYYIDKENFEISNLNIGQLIAVNCSNMKLKNVKINNTDFEVLLIMCSNCIIENSSFSDNDSEFSLVNSKNNIIRYNNMSKNFHGLLFDYGSENNLVYNNQFIINNNCGIIIEYFSNNNFIIRNNFIGKNNSVNAFIIKSFRNKWNENYWNDWIGIKKSINWLPKIICGRFIENSKLMLPFNFDWHPANEPYEIP